MKQKFRGLMSPFKGREFKIFDSSDLRLRMGLEPRDFRLLQLIFSNHVSSEEKADFFKDLDIEKEPMEFNLMLARLCHRHGWKGVPVEIEPRIRGAARFYLFKNAALFSSFRSLGKSLNKAGIPILLLKGAALKAAYDTDASRCLVDIDFGVPKQFFQEAVTLAEQEGYRISNQAYHSIDLKRPGSDHGNIDIHFRLFKTSSIRCVEEELADRARQVQAFTIDAWVPAPENLFIQLLENEFFNLYSMTENRRRFKWIYDCAVLLSSTHGFDWSLARAYSKGCSFYDAARSMLAIFADYLPQHLPESVFCEHFAEPSDLRIGQDRYFVAVLKWGMQGAYRAKLYREGKKWRSLLLRPFQMATEYRFLRMERTVRNFREFILIHCRAKKTSEVLSWVFDKISVWKKGVHES